MKTVKLIFLFILVIIITASAVTFSVGASYLQLGDTDGDGEVCITDATRIQRDVAKIIKIEEGFSRSADVDSDGIITIMDATSIQRWLVHFAVVYPIGEAVITPTEATNLSNEESSQSPTVTRNDKTVTVDGIDFNISMIPDAVTLDNAFGNSTSFMLRNKALLDPADVHIEVVSVDDVRRIDYSDERYKESYLAASNGKAIGCDYLICDERGNDVAWVNAHFTNTAYPYQVSVTGLSGGDSSFSVCFYYRDILLKQTNVTVDLSAGYGNCDDTKALVREIENECWKPDMTDEEKINAFAAYIKSHYTLRQLKCVDGALYTALAARDLGLDAMLIYPEENGHPDLITYNLYFNTTVPGGHCACLIEYDDCTMRYDVQGQSCVIQPYLH